MLGRVRIGPVVLADDARDMGDGGRVFRRQPAQVAPTERRRGQVFERLELAVVVEERRDLAGAPGIAERGRVPRRPRAAVAAGRDRAPRREVAVRANARSRDGGELLGEVARRAGDRAPRIRAGDGPSQGIDHVHDGIVARERIVQGPADHPRGERLREPRLAEQSFPEPDLGGLDRLAPGAAAARAAPRGREPGRAEEALERESGDAHVATGSVRSVPGRATPIPDTEGAAHGVRSGVRSSPLVTDFVAGGYLLVQPYLPPEGRPPDMMPADLLPSPLLTSSSCLAEILPSEWAFGTRLPAVSREERERGASLWGIPIAAIDGLTAWAGERVRGHRVLQHDAFADVEVAREFAAAFLPPRREVRLLGLGLRRDQVADYLRAVERRDELAFRGCGAPNGVRDGVERGLALEAGGRDLGFEVANVVLGQARESWLCFHVQIQVRDG